MGNVASRSRSRQLADSAWRMIRAVLVTYFFVVLLMMFFENWLVYPIPPVDRANWQPAGLGQEDVWFESADDTRLHGWFLPHPNPKRAFLYCHGNGEHVADNADFMAYLRNVLEASVFIFDYRGYGRSAGKPHEAGCFADGKAAQRWLAERMGIETSGVVLVGRSLGTSVAMAAAIEQGARALVLENGFTTMPDVAAFHYPWLPVRWAMDNRYNSLSRVRNYRGPLLQSHGTSDSVIPIRIGRQLFDACPSSQKQFLELPGRDHNDPPPAEYYRKLKAFLDEAAPGLKLG
ncbi:MAG: alpha/beta hydrolase [Planctomycetes bacterium]|nr:alpha/beta hydrolase [Planctomycetota bacterium]